MSESESGEPLFLERIDWSFYPGYLSSDRCRLASWYDLTTDADYIALLYYDEDGVEHTIYEYDLKRFEMAAALLDSAEMTVRIVENVKTFLDKVRDRLQGLPVPLVVAKLLNITGILALRLEACSPGALDSLLETWEKEEKEEVAD